MGNKPVQLLDDDSDEEGNDSEGEEEGEQVQVQVHGAAAAPAGGAKGGAAGGHRTSIGSLNNAHAAAGKGRRASIGSNPGVPAVLQPRSSKEGGGPGYQAAAVKGPFALQRVDSIADDASNDGEGVAGGTRVGGAVRLASQRSGVLHTPHHKINGRSYKPSLMQTTWMMLPFALWQAALLAIYVSSIIGLGNMQQPLASLNMATHVIYRYTHVRFAAFMLVAAQGNPTEMAAWRKELAHETENLESEYETLMYGGRAITQDADSFQEQVPAAAFTSNQFSDNFFRSTKCFRWAV